MRPHFMAPTGWSSRKTCIKCSTLSDPPIVDFAQEKGCLNTHVHTHIDHRSAF